MHTVLTNYNNSYSYNQNFKGSIDKSLINYLKEVRADIVRTKGADSFSKYSEPQNRIVVEAKEIIERVLEKLHAFMEKTHPDTKLILGKAFPNDTRKLIFVNTKLDSKIKGFKTDRLGYGQVNIEGIGIKSPKIEDRSLPDDELKALLGFKNPHKIESLRELEKWTNSLLMFFKPEVIDRAIFDKMIYKMSQKARSTSLIGRFITKLNASKANKLAEEFGREPVYGENFNRITQAEIGRRKILDDVYNKISKSVEELKNLKIK